MEKKIYRNQSIYTKFLYKLRDQREVTIILIVSYFLGGSLFWFWTAVKYRKIPLQSSNQLFHSLKKKVGVSLKSFYPSGQNKLFLRSQFNKQNCLLINGGHCIRENKFGGYIQSLSKSVQRTMPAQSSFVYIVNSFLIPLPHQVVQSRHVLSSLSS